MNNELEQEASRPIAADDREAVGLRPIIAGYLRQRTVILISAIISLVAAIIYLLVYPKTYEIMARIQIQDDASMMASGGIGLGDAAGVMKTFGLGGLSSGSGVSIDDEISTLRSNSLMRKMVTRLGLYAEYRRPLSFIKLYGEEPVHVICDSTTLDALDDKVEFRLTATDRDGVTIKAKADGKKETFHFDGFPAEVRLHGKTFRFERVKQRAGDVKLDITVYPPRWVAEKAADDFLIEDYSKSANIIELSCTDYERRRAKDMLNVLIDYYNQEAYDYKKAQSDVSLNFLNERIAHVMDELENVERNIERYKAANKITDVEYDIQYYAEYMRDLKGRMIEAETQANMIAMMDAFVKNPANRYKLVPSLLTSGAAETEGSAIYLYNQALLEREKAIHNSNEQNPMVASLTTQVDRLRETVFQSINNAQQSMQLTRRALEKQERELLDRMGSVPVQERIYVDYKRQQEILQGVYLILLQKREEISLALGQKTDRAKIVDTAFVKAKPVAPRKVFALAGFIVLTLVLSIGWIVCRDQYRLLRKEMKRTDTAAD
ncbi:hypothetical protein BHU11_00355 [Tannerella sp. oral taxon 808]|nr:hypothetical protein BHU11_00355 [Tannerella sp. oral taxon 808]